MALDDTYRYEILVPLELTEIELAALITPPDQLLEDEAGVCESAKAKAQEILERAVKQRLENNCTQPECPASGEYEIIPADKDTQPFKVCQQHLSAQVNSGGEIVKLETDPS